MSRELPLITQTIRLEPRSAKASLAWTPRFHRLARLIESEADFAQHQRERADQEAALAGTVAARLAAEHVGS
jgi:hypothetical protein